MGFKVKIAGQSLPHHMSTTSSGSWGVVSGNTIEKHG